MNSPADALLGIVIEDRYRIDALIARGGMSAVYLGVDLRLGRDVAVKVMDHRYTGDPLFLRRFEFEARAVAGLKHPGLVAVYDQGTDHDIVFLVMELVDGGSLRELLRERGPMPPHAVVAVADPVLGGLGTAHAAGLVHRDVKPENILISHAGEVKIADFGLVRAVAEAGVTSASVILGTAAYLSPEQVESAHADARSDVYSMGVMLFELLTGRTPFRGDTPMALAYQRLNYDVPTPGDVVDGVPPQLDEIILRATERDPAQRFPDGFAMRDALLDMADALDLPPFTVPAPHRSAEQATMARHRPAGPRLGGTRVQSNPGPFLPDSTGAPSPAPGGGTYDARQPDPAPEPGSEPAHADQLYADPAHADPARGQRPSEIVRRAGLATVEDHTVPALRAVLWLGFVLLVAVGAGVACWWLGHHLLSLG
ncbi:protein kinase [Gordonia sp. ABSL1-1]|uniref:protein kinase domain-containing protein n=1 Tax=Gordonia sp. ABSL1-1 TaxID=3053923 RepID=UPI0025744D42|nr:protein kinase [Gordonia sp. ABSL1-1]MDL9937385.1 protein kinase [Gordonia sp. ABSL1-1]